MEKRQLEDATYLVVDLEATCDDQGGIEANQMEIIEIGAVMIDGRTFKCKGEYQTFVRPVMFPILTEFCKTLTSIKQTDVDAAPTFPTAFTDFSSWMKSYQALIFCSWGDYDRKQIEQDCIRHGLLNPMPVTHLNVKRLFAERFKIKKRPGMKSALTLVGLDLIGLHHRGIDDARNIGRLLPYALGVPPSV